MDHTEFIEACSSGTVDDVKSMVRHDTNIWQGYATACRYGNLVVAQWFAENYVDDSLDHVLALNSAVWGGHVDVARWLLKSDTHKIDIADNLRDIFGQACSLGNLDLAKWLHANYELTENDFAKNSVYRGDLVDNRIERVFQSVCGNGHVHVAEWLYQCYPCIDMRFENDVSFKGARKNCQLDVMKWLYTKHRDIDVKNRDQYWSQVITIPAIEWLISVAEHDDTDIGDLLCDACRLGNKETAMWSVAKFSHVRVDWSRGGSAWMSLIRQDDLELVMLFQNVCPLQRASSPVKHCMYYNSNVQVTRFIASLNIYMRPKYTGYGLQVRHIMANAADWCMSIIGKSYNDDALNTEIEQAASMHMQYTEYAFQNACMYGYMDVAIWLADNYTIRMFNEIACNCHHHGDLFEQTCLNGHTRIAEWLIDTMHVQVINIEHIFNKVARIGQLDTLKWLNQRYGDLCNYDALSNAVTYKNLDITRWLLETYPDMDNHILDILRKKSRSHSPAFDSFFVEYTCRSDIRYYVKGVHTYIISDTVLEDVIIQEDVNDNLVSLSHIGCHMNVQIYSANPKTPIKYAIEYINYLTDMNKKSARYQ